MISFPNAKINLGLQIKGKRDDGYHFIQSMMVPVPFCDILEFVESDKDLFQTGGLQIPGDSSSNLVIKALKLLRQDHRIPPLKIYLYKSIPMGAGLGGGSSDAAFMIKMLNEAFSLKLGTENMKNLAAQLGSDCSFFIENKTQMVGGVGEILRDFPVNLCNIKIVLADPGFPVSTVEAYSGVEINKNPPDLTKILSGDIKDWKKFLANDFEKSIFPQYPQLESIKNQLYNLGAVYAAMSGSGSVIFGLFEELPENFSALETKIIFKEELS